MKRDLKVGCIEFSIFYDEFTWGDGTHESTKFIIELITKYGVKDKSVIDIGTGTGILSVLCGKMGAKDVLALDLDENSIRWAMKNFSENDVNVRAKANDLTDGINDKADIILANLPGPIQVANIKTVANNMNKDGLLIISWWNKLNFKTYVKDFEVVEHIPGDDYDAYVLRKEE